MSPKRATLSLAGRGVVIVSPETHVAVYYSLTEYEIFISTGSGGEVPISREIVGTVFPVANDLQLDVIGAPVSLVMSDTSLVPGVWNSQRGDFMSSDVGARTTSDPGPQEY